MPKATTAMTAKTRILMGAIGGVSPIIVSLLVVDFNSLFRELGLMDGIGLAVRFLVLIFIGGLVGYMHQSESEPFKVFQLGIAAPALLTTAINGTSVTGSDGLREVHAESAYSFFVSAHADEYKNSSAFPETTVSGTQQFLRGLVGSKTVDERADWFVVVGTHAQLDAAKAQVAALKGRGYLARVYESSSDGNRYLVAIGANLSQIDAEALRKQAIQDGLPLETHLLQR